MLSLLLNPIKDLDINEPFSSIFFKNNSFSNLLCLISITETEPEDTTSTRLSLCNNLKKLPSILYSFASSKYVLVKEAIIYL